MNIGERLVEGEWHRRADLGGIVDCDRNDKVTEL